MGTPQSITVDANTAVASVAHRFSEVVAIYPITPSSAMGELADAWSARGDKNLWGDVPRVVEMQSEAGVAGAVHGAVQAGALATTFTASQGLLLMIPNLYKIAGELSPFCLHVAARTVATHALSIFGDHSDVMACRGTGVAMLASGSVQEAQDLACIAHVATLDSRVPVMHFFDGFRTSHEISKIAALSDDDLRAIVDDHAIREHRARALTPDRPVLRGTAQNPDVFFQAREAANPFYDACPDIVERTMERFAARTGRTYRPFDYVGDPEAERVVVMMGSGAETAHETVARLVERGERVGLVKVRLYRPFSAERFLAALPRTARTVAVLDRTKEPGSVGEPLLLDVVTALADAAAEGGDDGAGARPMPRVVGGRYGLSSKEFTPAMVRAVFDELAREKPRRRFTVGIVDDVTDLSLPFDAEPDPEPDDVVRAVFYGLGSDGTVSANKNSIRIIGEATDHHAQGYFVYDSKKAGATTVSHLRFGPRPIRSSYLVRRASFVACHQFSFLDRIDILDVAAPGAVFLLNSPHTAGEVWDRLPLEVQRDIVEKNLEPWVVDAYAVAREAGLGGRISTVMQTCFFALSGVLPKDEAVARIRRAVETTYAHKGHEIVERNHAAIDRALDRMTRIAVPERVTTERRRPPVVSPEAPGFVRRVTAAMLEGKGDLLPVSAFPPDGTWPTGTARWEKRGLASEIPVWDPEICIQCNKCSLMCPHAAIRPKMFAGEALDGSPETFKSTPERGGDRQYALQVAPEDCTGCGLCVAVCPVKDRSNPRHRAIDMRPQAPLVDAERENFAFFLDLPEVDRTTVRLDNKGSQLLQPLFEFSGACAGCGETPYVKLLTQLFGDRALLANATGCSSIFGGNLPTTPYTVDGDGRGPAWANSLFEDNAEFGFGFRLALDAHRRRARLLLDRVADRLDPALVAALRADEVRDESGIAERRGRVVELRRALEALDGPVADELGRMADDLVRKSVWLVGGDGWAYDIGFGGLDHVLASRLDVNVLVLDTEVYSNTGGQQSKATPLAASAKFAVAGKDVPKKDLGLEAMSYGHVYVARVALGAKDNQAVRAFREADAFDGPSLILAYSHCIAHGYDLRHGAHQQKLAVDSGQWPLYRFDPRRIESGEAPLVLDSAPPKIPLERFMQNEMRFGNVRKRDPKRFAHLVDRAQRDARRKYAVYERLAGMTLDASGDAGDGS